MSHKVPYTTIYEKNYGELYVNFVIRNIENIMIHSIYSGMLMVFLNKGITIQLLINVLSSKTKEK